MPNTFIGFNGDGDGDVPAYASPLTPEQQRVADLEFRLVQQEYKLKHVAYLMARLDAALISLEAEKKLSAEQHEYIVQLHKSVARLGARGEAAFTKDRCWTLSLKITDEVIVNARAGLRAILGYHFANMQEEIERELKKVGR